MEGAKGVQLGGLALQSWKERPLDGRAAAVARSWSRRGKSRLEGGRPCRLSLPYATAAPELRLPTAGGALESYRLGDASPYPETARGPFNRVAFAAAHVVADPLATADPWIASKVDWDATIAYRRHLWALGFSVAEAMDTAQRGMGLDWPTALELIQRSAAAARPDGHRMLAGGAGTTISTRPQRRASDDVIRAYEEQFEAVEAAGSRSS
jgi:hypothetical protein